MTPIEYLKLQAKNLHKDFKTQTSFFDPELERNRYKYEPNYFKIEDLVSDLKINEDSFKLMNAQHIIAKLCGFTKWVDIRKACPSRMELAMFLFDNMDRVSVRDWEEYLFDVEAESRSIFDEEFKLQIFKEVLLEREPEVSYDDYRLLPEEKYSGDEERVDIAAISSTVRITSLPLGSEDRQEFITAAHRSFERVFEHIEPENPKLVLKMWDAERYIDKEVLTLDRLPVDREYALSMIDAFMGSYVIQLVVEADDTLIRQWEVN